MQTKPKSEPAASPAPGVIPAPARLHDDNATAAQLGATQTGERGAGREARRTARDEHRLERTETPAERPRPQT